MARNANPSARGVRKQRLDGAHILLGNANRQHSKPARTCCAVRSAPDAQADCISQRVSTPAQRQRKSTHHLIAHIRRQQQEKQHVGATLPAHAVAESRGQAPEAVPKHKSQNKRINLLNVWGGNARGTRKRTRRRGTNTCREMTLRCNTTLALPAKTTTEKLGNVPRC